MLLLFVLQIIRCLCFLFVVLFMATYQLFCSLLDTKYLASWEYVVQLAASTIVEGANLAVVTSYFAYY